MNAALSGILTQTHERGRHMNTRTGFMAGIGAGLMAGAFAGALMPMGRDNMKTQVGRSIRKLGRAVDKAVDNVISEMR